MYGDRHLATFVPIYGTHSGLGLEFLLPPAMNEIYREMRKSVWRLSHPDDTGKLKKRWYTRDALLERDLVNVQSQTMIGARAGGRDRKTVRKYMTEIEKLGWIRVEEHAPRTPWQVYMGVRYEFWNEKKELKTKREEYLYDDWLYQHCCDVEKEVGVPLDEYKLDLGLPYGRVLEASAEVLRRKTSYVRPIPVSEKKRVEKLDKRLARMNMRAFGQAELPIFHVPTPTHAPSELVPEQTGGMGKTETVPLFVEVATPVAVGNHCSSLPWEFMEAVGNPCSPPPTKEATVGSNVQEHTAQTGGMGNLEMQGASSPAQDAALPMGKTDDTEQLMGMGKTEVELVELPLRRGGFWTLEKALYDHVLSLGVVGENGVWLAKEGADLPVPPTAKVEDWDRWLPFPGHRMYKSARWNLFSYEWATLLNGNQKIASGFLPLELISEQKYREENKRNTERFGGMGKTEEGGEEKPLNADRFAKFRPPEPPITGHTLREALSRNSEYNRGIGRRLPPPKDIPVRGMRNSDTSDPFPPVYYDGNTIRPAPSAMVEAFRGMVAGAALVGSVAVAQPQQTEKTEQLFYEETGSPRVWGNESDKPVQEQQKDTLPMCARAGASEREVEQLQSYSKSNREKKEVHDGSCREGAELHATSVSTHANTVPTWNEPRKISFDIFEDDEDTNIAPTRNAPEEVESRYAGESKVETVQTVKTMEDTVKTIDGTRPAFWGVEEPPTPLAPPAPTNGIPKALRRTWVGVWEKTYEARCSNWDWDTEQRLARLVNEHGFSMVQRVVAHTVKKWKDFPEAKRCAHPMVRWLLQDFSKFQEYLMTMSPSLFAERVVTPEDTEEHLAQAAQALARDVGMARDACAMTREELVLACKLWCYGKKHGDVPGFSEAEKWLLAAECNFGAVDRWSLAGVEKPTPEEEMDKWI